MDYDKDMLYHDVTLKLKELIAQFSDRASAEDITDCIREFMESNQWK